MPLLDLKTELKSLTYQGNGPAVQKDINNPGVKASNLLQGQIDDVTRVTSFLLSTKGALFTAKQALLQSSQPIGSRLLNTATALGNIIGQVAVNGTGTHFVPPASSRKYTNVNEAASQAKYSGVIDIRSARSAVGLRTSENSKYRMGSGNAGSGIGLPVLAGPTPPGQEVKNDPSAYDTMPVVFQIYNDPASLILFRGFIAGLSDSFAGAWSPVDYVGRGESLYTYSKFSRTLSFTLTVPMLQLSDQYPIYEKVNSLVSYTAPRYNDFSGLAEGTFLKIRVGDYIQACGFLNSANVSLSDEVPWSDGVHKNTFLPQVLNIQLNFTVIQNLLPQRFTTPGGYLPYINSNRDRELQGVAISEDLQPGALA